MKLLACCLAVAALLGGPAVAGAAPQRLGRTVLVGGSRTDRVKYQHWIDAARPLAKQAKTKVLFRESNCPGTTSGISACVIESDYHGRPLRYYIPRELLNADEYDQVDLHNTVLHELGHVYDFLYNRDHHRSAWLAIFGLPGPFYSDQDPVSPPYERFAVGYSYCAEGLSYEQALGRFQYDAYMHRFTPEQYAANCALVHP